MTGCDCIQLAGVLPVFHSLLVPNYYGQTLDSLYGKYITIIMKGTTVQTFGARAVAGAWCMAGCLGHNYYYGRPWVQLVIRMRTANGWAGPGNADRIEVLATSHRLAA